MGSFTHFLHLISGKKALSKELVLNRKKLLDLWKEHLENYKYREDLVRLFKPGQLNTPKVSSSPRFWKDLQPVLHKLEALISKDLINIDNEERSEEEILPDLKWLTSKESREETVSLTDTVVHEFNKHKHLIHLFKKVHDMLNLELHLISLIKTKPKNFPELLKGLFKLIFHEESFLYRIFYESGFVYDKPAFLEIERIATAIFLGEELKEELPSAEHLFVSEMIKLMGNPDSEHDYRVLGEKIYIELAKLIHQSTFIRGDTEDWEERLRKLILDDNTMLNVIESVIRQNKLSNYSHEQIRWIMRAFRKSYGLEHFRELEQYIIQNGIEAVLQ